MGRSLRKGPFVDPHLAKKIDKAQKDGSRIPIKTWSRRSMITPDMIGCNLEVHNGRKFIAVFVANALAVQTNS